MHNVHLEAFEGPLDLLFSLIESNKIDIYDIPIIQITQQYLEVIRELPPDMESLSEFLVMAATLLDIKARMLLPRRGQGEEEEIDPREALVQKLVAYKYCQELAAALKDVEDSGRRHYKGPEMPLMSVSFGHEPSDWLEDVGIDKLWQVFEDVVKRQALKVDTVRHNFSSVSRERFTVADKINHISYLIKQRGKVRLSDLFDDCVSRDECIVTFLALLEVIRLRQATVIQQETFGEIEVSQCKQDQLD